LAGGLLVEGFEHHERREDEERQEAFDQGQSSFVASNFLLYNENESDRAASL
jgi:hypothetical protein